MTRKHEKSTGCILEETKIADPSGPRISTGPAGRSLLCLTGPTVNLLASGYVEPCDRLPL